MGSIFPTLCHTFSISLGPYRESLLNIVPDKSRNNSAATVKMVKDLYPFTKNNEYREIFEESYDFSDASNYKLTMGASGITFTGIKPNITFPQMNIANVQGGGLRLRNQTLKLILSSGMDFTICVVMQLWLNRSMSVKMFIDGSNNERPHLIYNSTTKKLELDTVGYNDRLSITAPSSFNGKRVVFWLSKKGIGRFIFKASISTYASTLTRFSSYASRTNYRFQIFTHDPVIYKVMHSSNFYDFDSMQYHKNNVTGKAKRVIYPIIV